MDAKLFDKMNGYFGFSTLFRLYNKIEVPEIFFKCLSEKLSFLFVEKTGVILKKSSLINFTLIKDSLANITLNQNEKIVYNYDGTHHLGLTYYTDYGNTDLSISFIIRGTNGEPKQELDIEDCSQLELLPPNWDIDFIRMMDKPVWTLMAEVYDRSMQESFLRRYNVKFSKAFLRCMDMQLSKYFIDNTDILLNQYTRLIIRDEYSFKKFNKMTTELNVDILLTKHDDGTVIKVGWHSKTGKKYYIHSHKINCDDIEFRLIDVDIEKFVEDKGIKLKRRIY